MNQIVDPETGEIRPYQVFLRTPYNYDMEAASNETAIACDPEEGMTQQQFKDETDINEIVRKFGLTGELPENFRPPQSGDFTEVMDFKTAMNAVRAAEESFMQMPADLRYKFANDPQRLISYLNDDKNREEAIALGLVNKPAEKTRDMVQAVDELKTALTTPKDTK